MNNYRKLGLLTLSSMAAAPFLHAAQDENKVNFLIIMTDQQRWDTINAAGNEYIHTPNLDKLLSQSVYFSQANCPVPVSGPSRTCMLTGHLLENTHVYTNADSDTLQFCRYQSYDQLLEKNGWKTEYYGKFHSPEQMGNCYDNPTTYGYEGTRAIKEWEQIYRHYLLDEENTKSQIQKPEELVEFSFYGGQLYKPNKMDRRYNLRPGGFYDEDGSILRECTQPDHHGMILIDDEHTITAFQAKQTIEAIKRLKDENFAITCSFHSPHAPMLATESYLKLYDVKELPVAESISDNMKNNPYIGGNGRLRLPEYSDPEKIRYMTAEYYALISEVDHWVGEILRTLEEEGVADNTVVMFLSDHGEMLGAHGMREKNNFLEESVRVPLLIRDPKMIDKPRNITNPVSCMNIFQTVMDYAGIEAESDGYSLKPAVYGEKIDCDYSISEWNRSKHVPNLMIRTNDWKLIINSANLSGKCDALFNLAEDPHELNNLLAGEQSAKTKKMKIRLMERLITHLSTKDYPHMDELQTKLESFQK